MQHVQIINWEKFNPRKDIKHPAWFAFSNRAIEDEEFWNFSGDEFKTWIYILSKASQKSSPIAKLIPEHAQRVCGIPPEVFSAAVQKLIDIKAIALCTPDEAERIRTDWERACTDSGKKRNATDRQTGTEQNSTEQEGTEQNPRSTSAFEVLKEFLGDPITEPVLVQIPLAVQSLWVLEFKDIPWIRKVIKKAVLTKSASIRNPGKWPEIITHWLINEHERPAIPKPSLAWTPPSTISMDEAHASLEATYKKWGVSSLTEAFEKSRKGELRAV